MEKYSKFLILSWRPFSILSHLSNSYPPFRGHLKYCLSCELFSTPFSEKKSQWDPSLC